jgi:hypothetical protein
VLFSQDDVALYVNQNFEPAWESVRPVPLVRIDFGNGTVLTRTLHGNIATSACTADGQVLDILPGIYAPAPYLEDLRQLRLLANYVDQRGTSERAARLREYHKRQANALVKNEALDRFVNVADLSKRAIEGGIKAMLVLGGIRAPTGPRRVNASKTTLDEPKVASQVDLANWKALAEDTRLNETERRRQIHEMLASAGPVKPAAVTKRLYKEVLHADLDDPYLGLGPALFTNYAFAKEDGRR